MEMKDFFLKLLKRKKKVTSNIPEQEALSKEFVDLIYPASVQHRNGAEAASLTLE